MYNINLHGYANKANGSVDSQTIPLIPQFIRNNITIIPIISKTQDSIGRDKKKEASLYRPEQSFSLSSLKISKEVTITAYKNDENNYIMSMQKKLPNITFDYVNPQPVFKIPETPAKLNKKIHKKSITAEPKVFAEKNITPINKIKVIPPKNITSNNKPKVISEKKVLSEKREVNNIISKTPGLIDTDKNFTKINSNSKKTPIQKQKKICNNILFIKNNSNKIIKNHSKADFNLYLEKENNKQRTSSPNKIFKKSPSISNTKSKTVKPIKEILNNSTVSYKVNKISDKDSIINNNIAVKTNKSVNENYMLMDISTEGKINIVPAYRPLELDFPNLNCVPEYDNFVMEISKSSEDNSTHLETSRSDGEKETLNEQELAELGSLTNLTPYSAEKNVTLDSIKNEQFRVHHQCMNIEDEINKLENEQKYNSSFCNDIYKNLQSNEMDSTTNTSIVQKDKQLLQKMKNIFCGNLVKTTDESKSELTDCIKTSKNILQSDIQDSSNVKYDENKNGFKRCKESQHDLYKKQKTDNENV